MGYPIQDQYATIAAYDVQTYQGRIVFAASTASTWRSRDMVITRPSATTLVLTLPAVYTEIVWYKTGRFAATGVAALEWIITTNNIAVDGTITLTSVNSAGAATAPAVNDVLYVDIGASMSVPNDRYVGTTA